MNRATRAAALALFGALGAAVAFAMTIYPFDYGLAESLLLAGALVAVAAVETVLDDASF
ncbi:hypothetical protein [Halobellus sp. EA9]|uniref:hypothetical protein n=1 Tax=Halobellus sp. EA9 TaxID=3421647 RepID=UPI003EBA0944